MSSSEEPHVADGLPEPGELLAEKYRVERVVGVGGMGVVVAAAHVQLEERVALKLMKPEAMNPDTTARFLREARAAAKIKSEHVARVNDVGVLPSGVPYMVMELLEGEDLGERIRAGGPLPIPEAVDYLLQACEAVAEAHVLGIIHRDLKPSNLFLARRPGGRRVVKVVDFGISKQVATEAMPMTEGSKTRTSAWLGSPLYMSPEQMRSAKDVDARADLWSLGLILYELTTAHVPFDAASLVELCGRVLHDAPTPIEEWIPDAPLALVEVIAHALEKDRELRYQTVAELAQDLLPLAPGASERVERITSILGARPSHPSAPRQRLLSSRPPPTAEADPVPLVSLRETPKPPPRALSLRETPKPPRQALSLGETPKPPPQALSLGETPKPPPRATSTSVEFAQTAGALEGPTPRRSRGAAWFALVALLALAGGTTAYLRKRTGAWPFAPAATQASPPVVTSQPESPPSAAPTVTPTAAASLPPPAPTVTPALSASPSAAPARLPVAAPAPPPRSKQKASSPVPHDPPREVAVPAEPTTPGNRIVTCFEIQPDGTRKTIACP